MRNIRNYSKKIFSLRFSIWELNPISFARTCNIPHEDCKPFDLDNFFYEFEKRYGLSNIVAEDSENYSYS